MGDAKKVIGIFLLLLLVIIGIGVFINRFSGEENGETNQAESTTAEEENDTSDGFLERILFSRGSNTTPTPTPSSDDDNILVIDSEDSETENAQDNQNSNNITTSGDITPVPPYINSNTGQTQTKGSVTPSTIPETGTPTGVILTSLAGLASGLYIKKRV